MKISKRLHEEGTKAILITLVIVVALGVLANWLWPSQSVWHYLLYAFLLIVLVLTIRFFRVPIWRETTLEEDAVLAPADGEIAANEEVMEDEYFHDKRRQISIFMSIYDVHINFFPFDGEVTYYKYHPGKFLVAFVARRIVCDLEPGDEAIAGEELGMIRFGSRVDVFLPLDADVQVKMGDRTTGKETVLARLK